MNLKTSAHKLYQDKDTAANFDEEGEGEQESKIFFRGFSSSLSATLGG